MQEVSKMHSLPIRRADLIRQWLCFGRRKKKLPVKLPEVICLICLLFLYRVDWVVWFFCDILSENGCDGVSHKSGLDLRNGLRKSDEVARPAPIVRGPIDRMNNRAAICIPFYFRIKTRNRRRHLEPLIEIEVTSKAVFSDWSKLPRLRCLPACLTLSKLRQEQSTHQDQLRKHSP